MTLLLVQFGIALLHHHYQGSYYDQKDQFHHLTTEAPCQGKVAAQSNLPSVFPADTPAKTIISSPNIIVTIQNILPCSLLPKAHQRCSSHDRAPPA
ncbi:hypothetical protein [Geoanaerobacter pelophilus]|nr:hypothetical protein [Geoanaerobacter pelophilus]